MNDDQILEQLRSASAGQFYMSESDYPFELIKWDGQTEITPDFLRNITGEESEHPVQEVALENFLGGLLQNLAQTLTASLSDVKVYKVGRINMPVYIVGRSPEGSWLGLSTRVVET